MPRTKRTAPRVSREKGQRSIDVPEALIRILPPWQNPQKFLEANIWRAIVAQQPVAVICRENLIAAYLSLDWKIEPKDSEMRDELETEIDYYTELFEFTGKYYYDEIIDLKVKIPHLCYSISELAAYKPDVIFIAVKTTAIKHVIEELQTIWHPNTHLISYQNGIDIEGGDIFLEGLRFCRQRASSVALYQIDALSLPFNNDYEVIGIFDVLEHIEDDERALAEMNRALKAGGKLILTVPAHKFLWSRHDEASHHKRRYSRMELIAKLERCGFTVNKATYYVFFCFPVLAAMRLLSKLFRNKKHEKDNIKISLELKTIAVVNDAFLASLRLEKYLIRHLNLPFGASLLVLAAKNEN